MQLVCLDFRKRLFLPNLPCLHQPRLLGCDPLQQLRRRFVVRVLRHQLSAHGHAAVDRDGQAESARLKQFYFDSQTGYLVRVRYPSSAGLVETQISDWRQVNGQALAGRIVRIVAGVTQWTFVADSLTLGADRDNGLFSGKP